MPYRIRRSTGSRPFQIINIQTGKVVGTSTSKATAQGSIAHRMEAEGKDIKKYKKSTDNKMRAYGETDFGKKTIRINKTMAKKDPMHKRKLHKNASKYPEILDTIVHEVDHVKHPKKLEKNVRRDAKRKIKIMSKKQKQKNYNLFK